MIYEVAREVQAGLQARGVPLRVVFGPERAPAPPTDERIVIQYEGNDTIQPFNRPKSNTGKPTPDVGFVRWQACVARVYARSPAPGANYYDHTRRANEVVDRLLFALRDVVSGRHNRMRLDGGQYIVPVDANGSEVFSGAVYELRFAVDRGIPDRNWDGTATREVVEIQGVGRHDPAGAGPLNIVPVVPADVTLT